MTKPQFRPDIGGGHPLLCPHCGDEYIHHKKIEVFQRKEDSIEGSHITISEDMRVDKCLEGNPSSRRDGVTIHFWCEGCNDFSRLNLAQHKGITLVEMLKGLHKHA